MCGIAGSVSQGRLEPFTTAVADALWHRGPDGGASVCKTGAAWSWQLSHTRLAIVDLSDAGSQPISNEDGSLWMSFNGEIYNSPELRRFCESRGHRFSSSMDGEVILHLWEIEGAAALARLNGIFSVAVADARSGEVVIARDPLGVKPLFYAASPDGTLRFASELVALRATGAELGSHDTVALAQFLAFLWVPDPRTPFLGARRLEPGHALRWSEGRLDRWAYAPPLVPEEQPGPMVEAEALEAARERFCEAARRQLQADVPIGLMASGGVDSGLLWWATRDDLERAYTIIWPADGNERLGEDRDAVGKLAVEFGTPVVELDGTAADSTLPLGGDLFADPAYDLTRLIARAARERGQKVLLSGQGGDELFAGYRRHSLAPVLDRLRLGSVGRLAGVALQRTGSARLGAEYTARLVRAAAEADPARRYLRLCTYSTARERAAVLDCTEREVADDVVWQRHLEVFDQLPRRLSPLRRALAVDLQVYLPGLGLAYVDRAGMEFGVEIRVPWLDLDLVRWSLTLPDAVLRKRGRGKWLTRELAARELPAGLGHRPKRSFAAPIRATGGGFRQAAYLHRARGILEAFLNA